MFYGKLSISNGTRFIVCKMLKSAKFSIERKNFSTFSIMGNKLEEIEF